MFSFIHIYCLDETFLKTAMIIFWIVYNILVVNAHLFSKIRKNTAKIWKIPISAARYQVDDLLENKYNIHQADKYFFRRNFCYIPVTVHCSYKESV